MLLLSDWQKQPSLLWIQVHTRGVLFVTKQFTFLSGSFFKFIAGVFLFRKGYLGQRNGTGHLSLELFPDSWSPSTRRCLFCVDFFLVFLEKMRALSEAKDAEFQWIGCVLWPVSLVCYKIMVKTCKLDVCISVNLQLLETNRFCFAYFVLCLFMPVNSQVFSLKG